MTLHLSKLLKRLVTISCCYLLAACTSLPNNNNRAKIFEKEWEEKIKQDKAASFNFQYDLLSPQRSYFVNDRLKYLSFRHGPEAGFVQCYVQFDATGHSIENYLLRRALPDYHKSDDPSRLYDTIFVFFPKQQRAEIYYADKLTDSIYRQDVLDEQMKFINSVTAATQKEFDKSSKASGL